MSDDPVANEIEADQEEAEFQQRHCDRCDVALRVEGLNWHGVGGRLVVGTMYHGDEDEPDQWEFFVDPVDYDEENGTLRSGRRLNLDEMQEIAWLVEQADRA